MDARLRLAGAHKKEIYVINAALSCSCRLQSSNVSPTFTADRQPLCRSIYSGNCAAPPTVAVVASMMDIGSDEPILAKIRTSDDQCFFALRRRG